MPFDALTLHAVARRWQAELPGTRFFEARRQSDRLWLRGRTATGQLTAVLVVLSPGTARLHRVALGKGDRFQGERVPFLDPLLPFTLTAVEVPEWERLMLWSLAVTGDLGETLTRRLIFELAGHLTNVVATDAAGVVLDAWRRVAPSDRGRAVWPGLPYQPPPAPSPTGSAWVRRWLEQTAPPDPAAALAALWHQTPLPGRYYPAWEGFAEDVWALPLAHRPSRPVDDLEAAVAAVFARREAELAWKAYAQQALTRLADRERHLSGRLAEVAAWMAEDAERERRLGDLWLAHQAAFVDGVRTLTVDDYAVPGTPVVLTLPEGSTPVAEAEAAYRRYRKAEARRRAAQQLAQQIGSELDAVRQHLDAVRRRSQAPFDPDRSAQDIAWFRRLARETDRSPAPDDPHLPFRRFRSRGGYEIWVGRNAEENQLLTFRAARPDDVWFHVKQGSGPHVLLRTGKAHPNPEDLLDAAHLAVFYSPYRRSSMVPVDYTRRKFVRKRPHAEPGQVLYRQEKTLYITPDRERLTRLGAMAARMGEPDDGT